MDQHFNLFKNLFISVLFFEFILLRELLMNKYICNLIYFRRLLFSIRTDTRRIPLTPSENNHLLLLPSNRPYGYRTSTDIVNLHDENQIQWYALPYLASTGDVEIGLCAYLQ